MITIRDNVHILENSNILAQKLAKYFQVMVVEQLQTSKKINIAISGGKTPKLFFDELANSHNDLPCVFWENQILNLRQKGMERR